MTRNPLVAFGLGATAHAFSARTGKIPSPLRLQMTMRSAQRARREHPLPDLDPVEAFKRFKGRLKQDPVSAGDALFEFVREFMKAIPDPEYREVQNDCREYEWQKRADLQ